MGHLLQPEVLAEVGGDGEELDDAPVVGLEKRLEGQDGEQLVAVKYFRLRAEVYSGRASRATARGDLVMVVGVFIPHLSS